MKAPSTMDVKMNHLAAHALDLCAAHLGVTADDLDPTGYEIVALDDGSIVMRVKFAEDAR